MKVRKVRKIKNKITELNSGGKWRFIRYMNKHRIRTQIEKEIADERIREIFSSHHQFMQRMHSV